MMYHTVASFLKEGWLLHPKNNANAQLYIDFHRTSNSVPFMQYELKAVQICLQFFELLYVKDGILRFTNREHLDIHVQQ